MDIQNSYGESFSADIQFAVAESYKTIRTNLQFLLAEQKSCKIITISSPNSGDGKTTNAVNLAIAFSQLGKRVLLIDADLRRPNIHKRLKIDPSVGLSSVLAGFVSVEETIVNVNSCFDVIPAGTIPPNPSELLASSAYERLISSLRVAYDYIIIDTPPLGVVSDALSVASKTEGILFVIREKATTHSSFEKVLESVELAGVKVLGVVLNSSISQKDYPNYKSVY